MLRARDLRSLSRAPAGSQSGSPRWSARRTPFECSSWDCSPGTRCWSRRWSSSVSVLIHVVLPLGGLAEADEDVSAWLADNRSPGQEHLSWIGSTLAGGLVIPLVIGLCLVAFLVTRHWLLAAFVLFVVALESGTYRATSLIVPRDRPDVDRLESLPVDASYPSGHTAASIALYGGLLLLLASRIDNRALRTSALLAGVAIPVFVGWARMYRGMHHITDVGAGVLMGLGALAILVFVARASRAAARTATAAGGHRLGRPDMKRVAVIAHAGKSMGGGLEELRQVLDEPE